jgi:lipopolysaccharide transport system ATP-binding protein
MSDISIHIEHLSKKYRLGIINNGTLFKDIQTWMALKRGKEDPHSKIGENKYANTDDFFWALKDITLDIKQGDRVGIIGKNGAGKSTLLKILSRITAPTEGKIKIKGKITSLLEVGTGFHGELTGRENIYLNGAILGMKKRRIDQKIDEIIAFSGIEHHIDTPVKRYSSGMYVRLAFAVAAHLDSDTLIADEVLAVGDVEFQKKALGKMQDLSTGQGRTILFVSHNMGAVRNLCKTGILLKEGSVSFSGNVNETMNHYMKTNEITDVYSRIIDDSIRIKGNTMEVYFISAQFAQRKNSFATDEDIIFIFDIAANEDVESFRLNTTIFTMEDTPIGSVSGTSFFSIRKNEKKTVEFSLINHHLARGDYYVSFSLGSGNFSTGQRDFDVIVQVLSFKIDRFDNSQNMAFAQWDRNWGSIAFKSKITILD